MVIIVPLLLERVSTTRVGVPGGLEAAVNSLRTIISTAGSHSDLCCLKVDMSNAFNECSRSSFLSRCKSAFPKLSAWVECITSTTGVQQADPLGPLLFALVLSDYLSIRASPDGLLYQLWYLDDGALVGSRPALATFLDDL